MISNHEKPEDSDSGSEIESEKEGDENDGEENPEAIAIKSAINNMESINIVNQVLEDTIL